MEVKMKMPDLATTDSAITVIRWLVEPGHPVQRGQPLLEIETDKARSEVESIATGILKEVRALPEAEVSVGQVIAVFEVTSAEPAVPEAAAQTLVPPPASQPSPAASAPPPSPSGGLFARNRAAAAQRTASPKPPPASSSNQQDMP
jgi:pyruvate/2-oxoglutarate dehydrogenase complex dihydrolipoamide acyltransferase (E2) component